MRVYFTPKGASGLLPHSGTCGGRGIFTDYKLPKLTESEFTKDKEETDDF